MNEDYAKIREMLLQKRHDEIVARGTAVIPHLIHALKDENWEVRQSAAWALGEIAKANPANAELVKALPALIDASKDEDVWVQTNATRALAEIGKPAVPALLDALKAEEQGLREPAAYVLGRIKDASAVPALIDALKDKKAGVRWQIVKALGEIGHVSAVPALIAALKDEEAGVRSDAAEALGKIGDSSAVPALVDSLKAREGGVRRRTAGALEKIAEKTEIYLEPVRTALKEFVDSVKKRGDPAETIREEREAAGYYIQIANAAAKFRAGLPREEGIILVGELPKPPAKSGKMYRSEARAIV